MNALWLTSWYPNKLDALNGDFVQRHAEAAALFCNVHVIHVEADRQNKLIKQTEVSVSHRDNLTEEIILYKLPVLPVVGKYLSFLRYKSIFKKYITAYIKKHGKPAIVHVHVPVKAGLLALWVKKKYGIRYVVTEHWAIYNIHAPDAFPTRNIFFKRAAKKIFSGAAMFTPVSANLGNAVKAMVANVPFTVVPNVVNTSHFNSNGRHKKQGAPFLFLHVSTLNYQKNPEAILRAYKKFAGIYPASKLLMVGGADDSLVSYASTLGIAPGNIQFTGFIPYKQVAALMKQSDAFVLFSRYENLPCVITEALCSGLPVISSDVGGISEIINSTNGILVSFDDEQALLNAMTTIYINTKHYNAEDISNKSIQQFCYKTVGENIVNIYRSLTGPLH